MKYFFILLFLLCTSLVLQAQPYNNPKGHISGKVIDAVTKLPVDYASIRVFLAGNTSPINGIVTDPKGNFTITNLTPGEYSISVYFIGYQEKIVDHLTISDATPNIAL